MPTTWTTSVSRRLCTRARTGVRDSPTRSASAWNVALPSRWSSRTSTASTASSTDLLLTCNESLCDRLQDHSTLHRFPGAYDSCSCSLSSGAVDASAIGPTGDDYGGQGSPRHRYTPALEPPPRRPETGPPLRRSL